MFNSTVELNKTHIPSNSTVGFINFTMGMKQYRLTNSTVGAIQTLHSTVQLNQKTHFNTIFESTWHHNRHLSSLAKIVDIIWDAIVWQHPFLTSGQLELDFWNSIQKNMITILIHNCSYQLYTRIRVSATAYLVWATLLGMSMYL